MRRIVLFNLKKREKNKKKKKEKKEEVYLIALLIYIKRGIHFELGIINLIH